MIFSSNLLQRTTANKIKTKTKLLFRKCSSESNFSVRLGRLHLVKIYSKRQTITMQTKRVVFTMKMCFFVASVCECAYECFVFIRMK